MTYDNVVCQDPVPPCEGGEECNPATGACDPLPDAPLSTPCEADGDPCTVDHCDGNGQCVYESYVCGACCVIEDGSCQDNMTAAQCAALPGETTFHMGLLCLGDADGNGVDDLCEIEIPAVSEWGLVILALLLLTVGKVYFGQRRAVVSGQD